MEMKPMEETIIGLLGIEFVEMTKERVTATMPVNSSTHQPYGQLHGGAAVVLAEYRCIFCISGISCAFWNFKFN